MDSSEPTRTPRRARLLLSLYVLTTMGLANSLPEMETTAEKLGALSVPVALLAAGGWYAYKDGGRLTRLAATGLAMFLFGAFGFGVIKSYDRAQTGKELDRELSGIRQGLVEDVAEQDASPEAARRHRERTEEATERLQESENPETAAIGKVLAAVAERTRASEERLLAALEAVGSERFLDVGQMLAGEDFEWQRATAMEYEAAARACSDDVQRLPQNMEAELATSGLDEEITRPMMAGFRRTWSLSSRACKAHVASAKMCIALIGFVEERRDSLEVKADGSVTFQSAEDQTAYDDLLRRAKTADEETNRAVEALQQLLAKG